MYLRVASANDELALCIYIDLCNAQSDGFLDHIFRNTGTTVKNQRHIACLLLDCVQSLKA